jgi:putative heme-binding domain-containing protein
LHAIYGGVYGKVHPEVLDPFKRTGDLMPVMVPFPASASASVIRYASGSFGKDFADNLFVANFNLHNVTRHILQRDGSTYKATDSVFVSSDNPDFHPTCVLEDADGSLLIIDTGGWYKICCPTSQLYKPEHLGAIYRVRKVGALGVLDPRGLKLDWVAMSDQDLGELLGDNRFCVRTRAVHELAKRGARGLRAMAAVNPLHSPEAFRNALWVATQIDSADARGFVRRGLDAADAAARSIALHSVSLRRDQEALPRVIQFLGSNEPPVRRIAAEAAGRIGDAKAVPALLAAAEMPTDRVLEHSIIYALIEIDKRAATVAGLDSTSSETRRCALIALDQMDNGKLMPDRVAPLLGSSDVLLQQAASWIIDHHKDWGEALGGYFRGQAASGRFSENLINQLVQFAGNSTVQDLVAEQLRGDSREQQLAALQVIARASLPEAPPLWPKEVSRILQLKNPELVRDAVLAARAITPKSQDLDDALAAVAADSAMHIDVRLNAIVARPNGHALEPALFDLCVAQIAPSNAVTIRVLATSALAKAALTREQVLALSTALKSAGPLELNKLLSAFERFNDEAVGRKLVGDLKTATAFNSLRADRIKTLFSKYPEDVQQDAEPLIAALNADSAKQAAHLDELLASLNGGDRDRGQKIFVSAKASCSACHCIGYLGGHVGPDLTKIGQVRNRRDLLEAIVYPSASFVRGFEPMIVAAKSGDEYSGIVKKDAPDEMVLVTGPDSEVKIARADITDLRPGSVSVMPDGLTTQMTTRELSDLITFLQSLK